jgi:ankyrin repeat protein
MQQALEDTHAYTNAQERIPIYFAKTLLEIGGAKNVELKARDIDGCTPLMLARCFQCVGLAKYLLSKGPDAHATDNEGYTIISSCLSKAAFSSLQEIMPDIAEHDYIYHPGVGVTASHHVAEWEALILLSDILYFASHLVNMVTILNGRTGLFSAIRRGNMQMVKLLLKPGADISIRDGDNITAVELA